MQALGSKRLSGKYTAMEAILILFLILGFSGFSSCANDFLDPRLQGTPQLIVEPLDNYFLIKNNPIEIECKALYANRIKFTCAGLMQEHELTSEYFDQTLFKKVLVSTLEVTKDEVKSYYGNSPYWCHCTAYNDVHGAINEQSVDSKRGLVQIAYLKRRFEWVPTSKKVALHSSEQLLCSPPEGQPLPEVYWKKDGVEIDVQKSTLIISSEGNLLFSQVKMSDMGNYTCGARNEIGFRESSSAQLIVYINGSWSSWSQWSDCSAKCGRGLQTRKRACSNPAPLNGGSNCEGSSSDERQCSSICPVDGHWSIWSSWSTCSTNCLHHRRRLCDNPRPAYGGVYCSGNDLDSTNCTGGMCRDIYSANSGDYQNRPYDGRSFSHIDVEPSKQVTDNDRTNNNNIALYIGICISIAVLATAIVIIVLVIRGRRHNQHAHGGSVPISSDDEKKINKNGNGVIPPDLTQTLVVVQSPHPTQVSRSPSMDTPNNNHVSSIENIYDKPDFGNDSRLSGPMSSYHDHSGSSGHSANSVQSEIAKLLAPPIPQGPRPPVMNNLNNNSMIDSRQNAMSTQLPSHIDADSVVWGSFTHIGGRLVLPSAGVEVTIPEGAIKKGQTEEIYLTVCRDDKDRPRLSDRQTVISPVIMVGPSVPGMLKKPIIISFQHCANMRQGGWMLSLCGSDSPINEQPVWKKLVTLGQENINTTIYCQLDPGLCHVMTDYLQRYTLIGESVPGGKATKILRLAAFANMMPPYSDFSIRVYVVEDTHDALEGVKQEERKFGGQLLDKPKQIPFQDGGHNLCLTIEEVSPGWRSKLAANYQEIPFQHIWSGTQNNLHCSFSLELVDRSVNRVSCKIQAYQKAILSNRQLLTIVNNFKEMSACQTPPTSTLKGRSSTVTTNSSSGFSSMVTLDPAGQAFRLPPHIKSQLCLLLDPPTARGNDWRLLAQALTVDRYIQFFATKQSPTEHILDLWEAKHREESAITDLMNIFRVMGRSDAAAVLEKDMGSWL